jgi:hypothetical protein
MKPEEGRGMDVKDNYHIGFSIKRGQIYRLAKTR